MAKVLGGLTFSTGLVLVVLTGAELFTSSTLTLTARASGRITWGPLLRNWVVVYVANFIGALTTVGPVYFGGPGAAPREAGGRSSSRRRHTSCSTPSPRPSSAASSATCWSASPCGRPTRDARPRTRSSR
nr:formate/nitrite transporter family protein [Intrasporangium sp.]